MYIASKRRQISNLDLVFSDTPIIDFISYKQLPNVWNSDHFPILMEVDTDVFVYKKTTNRLSTKTTDWDKFQDIMEKEMEKIEVTCSGKKLQEKYEIFMASMKKAINVASGRGEGYKRPTQPAKKSIKKEKQPVRWWDEDCSKAIKDRKKKLKIYLNHTDSRHAWFEYKRVEAEKENFHHFCNSITRFTSLTYVWNVMRTFKKAKSKINWNKWQVIDRNQVIREEIDKLSAPGVSMEVEDEDEHPSQEENCMDSPFIMEELHRAINMIRKDFAPGADCIDYKMIKQLPRRALDFLLSLFNEIWSGNGFPKKWREYQVLFIDKANKEKVRPISLSSCVGKVMERLVNERLVWWAEREGKIHPLQNGFWRGKSCIENLTKLTADIKAAIHGGAYGLAAFLDVSSAYDNVQFHILNRKLKKMKCPKRIRSYIKVWLKDREVEYIVSSREKIKRISRKGLPQGAVLNPILYALNTNDITVDVSEDVIVLQFADDIVVYTTGPNRKTTGNV
ncbi:uncharacterized protein LOC143894783 [Temnothorax americanus]|uniref:uncharacterized protein LOC143894783 n=1 Tax=Temnothorax americanus TaxID=1964332 RepID=UPI0040694189